MKRRTHSLAGALAMLVLAACQDGGPDLVDTAEPVPGDPASYAPDGWPLKIGDLVTEEDRDRLRREFLSPHRWAIHVVDDQLYGAEWDWPDGPHDYSLLVYTGHFPVRMPWYARDEERELPQRFHGRIEYEPKPPYTVSLYGVETFVDEPTFRAWREWQGRVAERREQREARR